MGDTSNDYSNFEVIVDSRRESDYLEMLRKLKSELIDKSSECEILKIKLDQGKKDLGIMTRELNECKLTMFQDSEDAKKLREDVMKSKKLEEEYVRLMSDFLNLSEQHNQFKQDIYDDYLIKTKAINEYECSMSEEKLKFEIEEGKRKSEDLFAELSLAQAKMRNLEEENIVKEKCVTELRKTLDDAKVTHKHEIKVLEEYIQCLKNTITSYEKTLSGFMTDPIPNVKPDCDEGLRTDADEVD